MTEFVGPDRTLKLFSGERFMYRISIDSDELIAMAVKASKSKSGKSKDGPLTVRIMERL